MAQYARFAALYDMFMDDVDYDGWAKYIAELIGRPCCTVLECGCGTGEITVRLKKLGFDITGSDISRDMLEVASEKARRNGLRIPFVRMDMRNIALHRQVDCIVAPCDCVNYLTSIRACEEFFQSAYSVIKPGGLLLFDVSSRYKLKNILGMNTFSDSREDAAYIWRNNYDSERKLIEMELEFFVRAGESIDGTPLFERFTETHIQRAHSEQELHSRLEGAGFKVKNVFDAFKFIPPGEDCERLQFIAIKQ
ncbi:MAG: class I SAM-dependent methyltransferase [Christensenellaceae bacterium]|nr:class I SAM-dependent methyltransferase [Christensenellaceae bacterium]